MAYIAGFFDGEGSVGIYPNGRGNHYLSMQLVQIRSDMTVSLFAALQKEYGGNTNFYPTPTARWKMVWQNASDRVVRFIGDLEPHLRFKKEQVNMAMAWQRNRPGRIRLANGRIAAGDNRKEFDEKASRLLKALKLDTLDVVMENQKDLVEVVHTLKAVLCVKGN